MSEDDSEQLGLELKELALEERGWIRELEDVEKTPEDSGGESREGPGWGWEIGSGGSSVSKEYSEFKRQQLELDDELKSVENQMQECPDAAGQAEEN